MNDDGNKVKQFYDSVAKTYDSIYDPEKLYDTSARYPANYIRLQLLLNSFISKGIKRVIEVGVGEGTPLSTLGEAGIDVWGFDISLAMVEKAKENVKRNGMNPDQIFVGNIEDPTTYVHAVRNGLFEGLMAMGVMPHVEKDDFVLTNISSLVRPGGSVFIEFRNKLFSLFSFNRYTLEFILDDLLTDVCDELKDLIRKDLEPRLQMDISTNREEMGSAKATGYDSILAKFHNPFEVVELFNNHGFGDIKLHWYHYHPSMPYLAQKLPDVFREEAIRLEHSYSNWRGYFLCSAFLVEAIKG